IDRDTNRMYEMYRAFPIRDMAWKCDAGALFHLDSDNVRPTQKPGWTSADAAGLPIFPGLARYDEAATGVSHMRCASPWRIRAKPMCRPRTTGRRTTRIRTCRPWECVFA